MKSLATVVQLRRKTAGCLLNERLAISFLQGQTESNGRYSEETELDLHAAGRSV